MDQNNGRLEILTFGSFDILIDGESLLTQFGKSQKALSLLKYFISNRGKKIPVNRIIEANFKLYDYTDYNNALRSQVHRLRNIIKDINSKLESEVMRLDFVAGNYIFKLEKEHNLDVEKFEDYVSAFSLNPLETNDDADRVSELKKALKLYRGDYIEGAEFYDWVFPLRIHYKRQYLVLLSQYISYLVKKDKYDEVISECESALSINFFDEVIHEYLLEALFKSNKANQALNHYNYVTSRFYTEMNMKPSEKMKEIYQKVQKRENSEYGTDLFTLERTIRLAEQSDGVFFCDKDFFINLYRLELRKKERDIGKTMVGIVTVSAYDLREISEEESVKIVEDIGPVVDKYMRKYDVITKLNKNQFAFMMFNSSEEMIKRINQRMNFLLNQVKKKHRILFTLSCKPLQATDENYNETAF